MLNIIAGTFLIIAAGAMLIWFLHKLVPFNKK